MLIGDGVNSVIAGEAELAAAIRILVRRQVLQLIDSIALPPCGLVVLVAHRLVHHFVDRAAKALILVLLTRLFRGNSICRFLLLLDNSMVRVHFDQAGALLDSLQFYVGNIVLHDRRFVDNQCFVQGCVQDGRVAFGAALLVLQDRVVKRGPFVVVVLRILALIPIVVGVRDDGVVWAERVPRFFGRDGLLREWRGGLLAGQLLCIHLLQNNVSNCLVHFNIGLV